MTSTQMGFFKPTTVKVPIVTLMASQQGSGTGSAFTYNSVPLGGTTADFIFVTSSCFQNSSGISPGTCTVDGQTVSAAVTANRQPAGGSAIFVMYVVPATGNATGQIVTRFSGGVQGNWMTCHRVSNIVGTVNNSAVAVTNAYNRNLVVFVNSLVFGGGQNVNPGTYAMTGVTMDVDANPTDSGGRKHNTGWTVTTTANAAYNVTMNYSSPQNCSHGCAVFTVSP